MAKLVKIVYKMLCRPADMRFSDIKKVLKSFRWHLVNTDGSHFIYENDEQPGVTLTIVVHKNKVWRYIIDRIIERLNLEEWYEINKD